MLFLLKIKLISLKNIIKKLSFTDNLKITAGILLAISFLWFLYIVFYRVLSYIQTLPFIGSLLILKFLAISFLTTFIMVAFSSLIVSISTIFYSQDLSLLFSLPLKSSHIYITKMIEVIIQTSWMMVIVMVPFLISFINVKQANLNFIVSLMLLSIPFLFISASTGILLGFWLIYLFPFSKVKDIVLILTVLLGSTGYVLFRFLEPEKLANPEVFLNAMQYLAYLNAPTAEYLPSWWITSALNSLLLNNKIAFILNSIYLFGLSLLLILLSIFLSEKLYYKSWVKCQSGISDKKIKKSIITISPSKNIFRTLILKEIIIFLRDTKQWSQVLLVIAMIIVYVFSLYKLPVHISGNDNFKYLSDFIGFLNIAGAGFILSALALRFAFPQISLEKGSLWFMLSIPVRAKTILFAKYFVSLLIILTAGLSIVIITNILLKVSTLSFIIFTLIVLILSTGITSIAFGTGVLYPKFRVENVSQIETSQGGIIFMISSFFYVCVSMLLVSKLMRILIYQKYVVHSGYNLFDILYDMKIDISMFFLINIIAILLPLILANKSIKNYQLKEWIP